MRKIVSAAIFLFFFSNIYSQQKHKLTGYLQFQYTHTLYDLTKGNNLWGIGTGLFVFIDGKSAFKPALDLTADIYLVDDKVYRMYPDGSEMVSVHGTVSLFPGISFQPKGRFFAGIYGGPSLVSSSVLLGIKPSMGIYFDDKHRWAGKLSYINIFNRDYRGGQDFGSWSASIGVRIF